MQLMELENSVLAQLLCNSPPPNFGGAPAWGSYTNAKYPQLMVDDAINRAAQRLLDDLGDVYEGLRFTYTFTSLAQQYAYPIPTGAVAQGSVNVLGTPAAGVTLSVTIGGIVVPYVTTADDTSLQTINGHLGAALNASSAVVAPGPLVAQTSPAANTVARTTIVAAAPGLAGNAVTLAVASSSTTLILTASGATLAGGTAASPAIRSVTRVFYNPVGLPYQREMVAGAKLLAWDEYQRYTAAGYLQPYSFGTEPWVCAVNPANTTLNFYPGPNSTGDLITLEYIPILTAGTGAAPMVAATDVPFGMPADWYDALLYGALAYLWMVARESSATEQYRKMYAEEVDRLKTNYRRRSRGDSGRIIPQDDVAAASAYGAFGAVWGP